MRRADFEPIHESNLVPGQQYYLRIKGRGEGLVRFEVGEDVMEYTVEILDGGFNWPGHRTWRKGESMTVTPGQGSWYEIK